MDTQAVAGVESVIYTTSDIGMANTLADMSRTGVEVKEFNGVYQVECTTPEQIASFFSFAGADIKASFEAQQWKDMGSGRVVYDMSQTNAGAAVIQYNYPDCYTPNVGQAVGKDCWWLTPNTPENRQLFANEWLDSEGMIDSEMKGLTNNGDGSPVYTTPDTWYGVFHIDGKEYFTVDNLPDIEVDLNRGGDVEITAVQHDNDDDWTALCYKTVSPIYNIPLMAVSSFASADIGILAIVILKAMGRIS